MSKFDRKHPELAAKLRGYVESGMNPDEIIAQFKKDDEDKIAKKEDEIEDFPDEIKLISQALAYRSALSHDANDLYNLLLNSYSPEVTGAESFRIGDSVSKSDITCLLDDKSYHWLIVEAPMGREVESDGVLLGACCYSTDGVSRCNGVVEGKLGSIRFLAVLPRYHGFCVGRRLLQKAEETMFREGCCRVMTCIPSTRVSMLKWIERRNYLRLGAVKYPAAGLKHLLKDDIKVDLVQYIKTKAELLNCDVSADDKFQKVYSIVSSPSEHSASSETTVSTEAQDFSGHKVPVGDISSSLAGPPTTQKGKMNLPPLWRHLAMSADCESVLNSHNQLLASDGKDAANNRRTRFVMSEPLETEVPDVD